MNDSANSLPPDVVIQQMISLGFVVTAAAGEFTLSTVELVPYLLKEPSSANSTLKPFLPPDLDPITALNQLNAVLPLLPRDETWLKWSAVLGLMSIISFLVVGARFYVRLKISPKRLQFEDWLCFVALVITQAWLALFGVQCRWAGRHIYLLNLAEIRDHQLYMSIEGLLFNVCHILVKYTFLVFYYRLYPHKWYHRAVMAVAAYVLIICTIPGVMMVFGCQPFDFWDHLLTARCWDRLKVLTWAAIALIIADFMILSLPIPVVLRLELNNRDRVLLIGLFGLGGLISIASILRLFAVRAWLESPDFTYAFGPHLMLASVEVVLSLAVSCAPALKAGISNKAGSMGRLPKGFSKWSFTPSGIFKNSHWVTEFCRTSSSKDCTTRMEYGLENELIQGKPGNKRVSRGANDSVGNDVSVMCSQTSNPESRSTHYGERDLEMA